MEIERTVFGNATVCKIKNRRIMTLSKDNGDYSIKFKSLVTDEDYSVRAGHIVERKSVTTVVNLSTEATMALFMSLASELNRKGLISIEGNI
jgi:hypothetical protein